MYWDLSFSFSVNNLSPPGVVILVKVRVMMYDESENVAQCSQKPTTKLVGQRLDNNIDNNNQPFSSLQHRCRPSQSPSHADLGDNWYFQHQPFESSTFSSFVAGRISICFREYLYVRFSCGSFQLICTNCTRCSSPHRWYYLNASNKSASEAPVVNRLGLFSM